MFNSPSGRIGGLSDCPEAIVTEIANLVTDIRLPEWTFWQTKSTSLAFWIDDDMISTSMVGSFKLECNNPAKPL